MLRFIKLLILFFVISFSTNATNDNHKEKKLIVFSQVDINERSKIDNEAQICIMVGGASNYENSKDIDRNEGVFDQESFFMEKPFIIGIKGSRNLFLEKDFDSSFFEADVEVDLDSEEGLSFLKSKNDFDIIHFEKMHPRHIGSEEVNRTVFNMLKPNGRVFQKIYDPFQLKFFYEKQTLLQNIGLGQIMFPPIYGRVDTIYPKVPEKEDPDFEQKIWEPVLQKYKEVQDYFRNVGYRKVQFIIEGNLYDEITKELLDSLYKPRHEGESTNDEFKPQTIEDYKKALLRIFGASRFSFFNYALEYDDEAPIRLRQEMKRKDFKEIYGHFDIQKMGWQVVAIK